MVGGILKLKRCFDIFLSLTGIFLSFPLWLLIAFLIYFEDRGSIFFIQHRVGRGGRLFRAFKFRSMKPGAEKLHPNLQAREDDPRVTHIGRILRATAMDELPQLLNILKGEMSFVGPRALLPDEIEVHGSKDQAITDRLFERRCAVTPGLTGVAQIFAPRDVPRRKKFRYDIFYIEKQSFLFDLKLILLSFWITFRGKWESREDKIGQLKGSNV
jgi:lipopolysaccharide/colanic/teichoic acid biosynthesis glycosyltransferase